MTANSKYIFIILLEIGKFETDELETCLYNDNNGCNAAETAILAEFSLL